MPFQFEANKLVVPGINKLAPYEPGKSIEELEQEQGISNVIKLASNENPLGPSPNVIEALVNNNLFALHRYPDGSGHKLKTALAQLHQIDENQICLGNGSNDILDILVRTFVKQKDFAIISEHAFVVYYLSLVCVGANIKIIDALDFGHDISAMAAAVDKSTKIIFIANPNNPTGTWSTSSNLRDLLNNVPQTTIVVIDEAYAEYVTENDYPNCIDWLPEYPNLVVTRSFSKIYGLGGLRIGYSVSSPEICELLNRVRHPFNCNSLALEAARIALADQNHCKHSCVSNREQMQVLVNGFGKLGLKYIESVGNFVSVDVGPSAIDVNQKLLQAGVIVRPIASYGLANHLRVTVGTQSENDRILAELEKLKLQGVF